MQYLKPNVCKQLEAMGLVSDLGFWYALPERMLESGEPKSYVLDEHYEVIHVSNESAYYAEKMFPAFTISDILLNADNAKLLWGEKTSCKNCGGWVEDTITWYKCPNCKAIGKLKRGGWKTNIIKLLNLHLSGTDIEPELQEAIESKPL